MRIWSYFVMNADEVLLLLADGFQTFAQRLLVQPKVAAEGDHAKAPFEQ